MSSLYPPIIRRKLERLKWLLRFYTVLDGLASILFVAAFLLVSDFVLDRFFELPQMLRFVLLPILGAGLGFIVVKQIRFRWFASIRSAQLAAVLEHYVPQLNESLLTTVEWSDNDEFDANLMRQTIDEAAAALRKVNVRWFFNTRRLAVRFCTALLCVGLITAFGIVNTEIVSLWFSRNILLSQQEYPRRSQLIADGFQDGKIRIGRGDSFTFSLRANMQKPLVPETIRVRIGTEETGYRILRLEQFHTETEEGSRWRVFAETFPEMLETMLLQVRGADSTLDLCIEVVPPPTLTDMTLQQHFPDYMQRQERTVPLTGRTTIPEGTGISLSATSTKPLQDASAIINQAETSLKPESSEPFDSIELSLPSLREETRIDFRLTDTDSLTNRQPIRAELGIIQDQPPVVTARLEGIGSAVTPEAILPIVGEITDDYGLKTATYRYTAEPAPAEPNTESTEIRQPIEGTAPITGIGSAQTVFPLEQSFSISELTVLPGDKLNLSVEASDGFNLDTEQGQTGAEQRWSLEIVTPEQLKTMLETREIALRQRFEVVLGEVERTKNILSDYSLEPMEQQIQEAESLVQDDPTEELTEEEQEQRQRDWETKKQKVLDTILAEQAELGIYHIARMLRDTQKEGYDVIGIVESFRGIRQEMINNKIFTEEERRRIDSEIMRPLQELADADFPEIDRLLGALNQLLLNRDEPNRPAALLERQRILEQFDRTILKMAAIRDKMASMETFNEAVELLRSIIKQQQQLKNETLEEKNNRLRDLLN